MVRFGGLAYRSRSVAREKFLFCLVGVWAVLSGAVVAAQDAPTTQDEPIHTLHVYANLLKFRRWCWDLILNKSSRLRRAGFRSALTAGHGFARPMFAWRVTIPISLSILLDVNGNTAALMAKIGAAFEAGARLSLHPEDHVSIYALDCTLIRSCG